MPAASEPHNSMARARRRIQLQLQLDAGRRQPHAPDVGITVELLLLPADVADGLDITRAMSAMAAPVEYLLQLLIPDRTDFLGDGWA